MIYSSEYKGDFISTLDASLLFIQGILSQKDKIIWIYNYKFVNKLRTGKKPHQWWKDNIN